jgi:hypothetical protein
MFEKIITAKSMSNPPPVKTPLPLIAAAPPATNEQAPPSPSPPPHEPPRDPKQDILIRLLRPVPDTVLHPEAEKRLPQATAIIVTLDQHRLRILQNTETLVDAPVASGRPLSPTPEGDFTLAHKPASAPSLRYGHYRTASGSLLVRGAFPKIDPLPVEAVFDPVTPKIMFQLSNDGPLLIGGEATGAATTDGTLVLPDKIAVLLHDTLPLGLKVTIER